METGSEAMVDKRLLELVRAYIVSKGRDFTSYRAEKGIPKPGAFWGQIRMGAVLAPAADVGRLFRRVKAMMSDEGFSGRLLRHIRDRGISEVEAYTLARVDRRLFSKIRSDPGYHPQKRTVAAFVLALELSREDAGELFALAGYALSPSNAFDAVIDFAVRDGIHDIDIVNELLLRFDLPLLGVPD